MTETDVNNYEIIDELVKDHFNLSYKSYEDFHKLLWNKNNERVIDPKLKELLGDDLRYSIPIGEDMYPAVDEGWELFKKNFDYIIYNSDFDIQYRNYKENSIEYKKNKLKLFKAVKKYYKENENALNCFIYSHTNSYFDDREKEVIFDEAFTKIVEEIGTKKMPNQDMTIVLSLNYADWFLCATAENWDSCLNLESEYEDAFWSGLPGLIGDPNRMMFYITNGKRKTYNEIEADKIISRTWGLLTDENAIHPVMSYPVELLEGDILQKVFTDFKFLEEGDGWTSKYPLTILRNTFGQSVFIYQDTSTFLEYKDKHFLEDSGGSSAIIESSGYITDGSPYYYCEGLSRLIRTRQDISNFNEDAHICEMCNERINEEETYHSPDGGTLCEYCYTENYTYCEGCNEDVSNEDMRHVDGEYLCEDCFDKVATYCADCSEAVKIEDVMVNSDEDNICQSCSENYVECESCKELVKDTDVNEEKICSHCAEEGIACGQ